MEKIVKIIALLVCIVLKQNLYGDDQLQWITKSGQRIDQVLAGRCNVYLLRQNDKILLVDTSTKVNRVNLIDALSKLGIDRIDFLLLTHTHFDHVENARFISSKFGAKIIVSDLELENLIKGHSALPKGTNPFTKILSNIGNNLSNNFLFESTNSDITITQEFDLKEMGFNAKIIPTPGHSIGSISLVIDNEIAIVGDAAFGVIKGAAYPPFADDSVSLVKSWKVLIDRKCLYYLPSHGNIIKNATLTKEYNKYAKQLLQPVL